MTSYKKNGTQCGQFSSMKTVKNYSLQFSKIIRQCDKPSSSEWNTKQKLSFFWKIPIKSDYCWFCDFWWIHLQNAEKPQTFKPTFWSTSTSACIFGHLSIRCIRRRFDQFEKLCNNGFNVIVFGIIGGIYGIEIQNISIARRLLLDHSNEYAHVLCGCATCIEAEKPLWIDR